MKPDSRWRPQSFLSWHEAGDGQTVAVDSQEGKVYHFNGSAAEIWKLLDGHSTVSQIIGKLSEIYDCPKKKLEKDTVSFLKKLFENDLITPGSPS